MFWSHGTLFATRGSVLTTIKFPVRAMSVLSILLLMCLEPTNPTRAARLLEVLYEWKDMEFAFPSPSARNVLLKTRAYIPGNSYPIDVDAWLQGPGEDQVFVTIPRSKPGVPSTLNTVIISENGKPLLSPYPDWSWHREGDCDGITSVFRVQTDQCGRLWVLDSGTVNIFSTERKRICQPQLLVFSLKNKKMLLRYRIPNSVLEPHSILTTVVADILDVNGHCRKAFAYLADVTGYGLIVVDAYREKSWRVVSNYFYPYPLHGHFELNNVQFDLMDGVLGLALSPPQYDKRDKTLYFHSLASVRESWVSAALLRNESNFPDFSNAVPNKFYVSQGTRAGQAAPSAMNGEGSALFFSVLTKNSLNCWNPKLPYNEDNIVELDRDDVTFQFASGLKVIRDRSGAEWVWAFTSRFQNIIVNKVNPNEVNYRILVAPVAELVKGTSCAPHRSSSYASPPNPIAHKTGYVSIVFP